MRVRKSLKPLGLFLFCLAVALALPAQAGEMRYGKTLPSGSKCELVFAANPLMTMTEIPFAITLTETHGAAVSDATLTISLDMPAMPMPPNRPTASWHDNAYRGAAVFTMAGAWQAKVQIQRPGMTAEEVVFEIKEVQM